MRNTIEISIKVVFFMILLWYFAAGTIPIGESITDRWLVDDSGLNRGRVQIVTWSDGLSTATYQYMVVTVQSPPFGIAAVTSREAKYESLTMIRRGVFSLFPDVRWEPAKEAGLYTVRWSQTGETRRVSGVVALFHQGREAIARQGR